MPPIQNLTFSSSILLPFQTAISPIFPEFLSSSHSIYNTYMNASTPKMNSPIVALNSHFTTHIWMSPTTHTAHIWIPVLLSSQGLVGSAEKLGEIEVLVEHARHLPRSALWFRVEGLSLRWFSLGKMRICSAIFPCACAYVFICMDVLDARYACVYMRYVCIYIDELHAHVCVHYTPICVCTYINGSHAYVCIQI